MLALEEDTRNRVILRLLYATGMRVSELCALRGRHCQARGEAGQLVVRGKGNKTRVILLSVATWQALAALREEDSNEATPLFRSRQGGALSRSQVYRIVKQAARPVAGVELLARGEPARNCAPLQHQHLASRPGEETRRR